MFDYLIVGAGLYGAVFAREATDKGKKCLVIDKRNHIAGNVYTEEVEGIQVHKYGAHIFHTSDQKIWDYVNRYAEFNHYVNAPIAIYQDELYNLPFNMNTFSRLWNIKTPFEAQEMIKEQTKAYSNMKPRNLEEQALSLAGVDIYEKLIKGYTEKQWGRPCSELPAFIIRRLPFRFTYDNNYFNDRYQGIPVEGYTSLVDGLLEGIEVRLNTNFFEFRKNYSAIAKNIVYTGMIDAYFNYCFGELAYRSLQFEHEVLDMSNYQGNAVVNYTDRSVPYTRILEHKHFTFGTQEKTVITREYPKDWQTGAEPYYPINDDKNNMLYQKYRELALKEDKVYFGGRLADYRYYDMHQVIASALKASETIIASDLKQ